MSQKPEIDYSWSFLIQPRKIFMGVGFILLMLIWQYPFKKKFEGVLNSSLKSVKQCPISYSSYQFNFLGIEFKNVTVSCRGASPISLKNLSIGLSGFVFSPLGPSFNIESELWGNPVEFEIAVGINSFSLFMENKATNGDFEKPEQKIALSSLANKIPILLNGDIYISQFQIKSRYDLTTIDLLNLNITSNNIVIPNQTIGGFSTGRIPINNFLLQAKWKENSKKPELSILNLVMGDEKSPILAKFSGHLNPIFNNVFMSRISLQGELKLDTSTTLGGLLSIPLAKLDQKDEWYQMQINGVLAEINLNSISSPR